MPVSRTKPIGAVGIVLLAVTVVGIPIGGVRATPASKWAVIDRWTLGGTGGWDYLITDPAGARLFLSRATRVDVVDTQTGKLIGSIANTHGVHGIALATALHRGFTSNGKGDSVTAFDLDTLKIIKESPVSGHNPDAILYEPVGKHVVTFNGGSKDATVLDANTLAVVSTIPLPDKPEFAVDDGAGTIFVNIESEPGQIVAIDSGKLTVKATWTLPGCASPTGLAIDKMHHRLFSVCDGVMAVTDAVTGTQVAKIKVGAGPDAAAFDAERGLVFSSNGDGTLTIIHQQDANRYHIVSSLPTQRGARTMALDAVSGKVYLVSADLDPPPAPTAEQPHPRPVPRPGTFVIYVVDAPRGCALRRGVRAFFSNSC